MNYDTSIGLHSLLFGGAICALYLQASFRENTLAHWTRPWRFAFGVIVCSTAPSKLYTFTPSWAYEHAVVLVAVGLLHAMAREDHSNCDSEP